MGISDGAFDCVFAILSKSIPDYFEQINSIFSNFEDLIVKKVLGTIVDTQQYNKKYFIEKTKGESVVFGGEVIENKIDKIDRKIIGVLANNARIPITELAKKVNSSVEVVKRRMKSLKEKEIILNYRVSVDLNKLGFEFFKAIIYFKSLSKKDEERLFEWMLTNPNSVYYIRSLAPWEVEFEFVVENYLNFNKIINNLRKDFSKVISHYEHLILIEEIWMPAYKEDE